MVRYNMTLRNMRAVYYDFDRGKLVPNTLKTLKNRHDEFTTACEVCEADFGSLSELLDAKKWWTRSIAKMKADSLLNQLDTILINIEVNEESFARYTAMKACVLYQASEFLMDKCVKVAIQLLKKAHELLWPLLPQSEVYWLYFCTVVNYVELASSVKSPGDPLIQMLEEAVQIYESVEVPKTLFTCKDLFSLNFKINPKKESRDILEQNVTRIFQLLINLYICNMETMKYVKGEHFLLKRELQSDDVNIHEWINRTTILSKILITEHDFRNARHHLAIATLQFQKHFCKSHPKTEEDKMKLRKTEENLATAWIKYGLKLLGDSKNALMAKYSRGDAQTITNLCDDKDKKSLEVLVERNISEHSTQILDQILNTKPRGVEKEMIDDQIKAANAKEQSSQDDSSIIEKALLLQPQDTSTDKLSDALSKDCYVDLRFPGGNVQEFEQRVPRCLIDSPKEAADLLLFLLTWIDLFKQLVHTSARPVKYAESILELNNLFKLIAFFQPDPKQQYELHKERQTDLELLAWLLKKKKDPTLIPTEIIVARELSIVHYQLTEMNLKRIKQLEEERDASKSHLSPPAVVNQVLKAI